MAVWLNITALLRNPLPMLIWAALISLITIIGLATAFLWFIFAFPWLGFASWRAYRDLIGPFGEPPRSDSALGAGFD